MGPVSTCLFLCNYHSLVVQYTMKSLIVVSCLLAVAAAGGQSTPEFFNLVSNATSVLARQVEYGFDCAGKQFGFYADTNNACQIFHICHPEETEAGPVTRMYSFLCGLGTVFDQATLACNWPEEALACEESENLYNINDYFGREDVEFRSGLNDIFKK